MKTRTLFLKTSVWLPLALCLLSAAAAPGADWSSLRFEARLVGPATIDPLQAAEIELVISNATAAPLAGVPRLAPVFRGLTFHLRHDGKETSPGQPIMVVKQIEGIPAFHTLARNASDLVRFHLAFDWDAEQFLFQEPGDYEVWVTLRSEDSQQTAASPRLRVQVRPPGTTRQAEIDELLASRAFQYAHTPEAITFDRAADDKSASLAAFASRHPGSPYSTEIPFVVATLHEYRALVTLKADRTRADEHRRAQKTALLDYLRQPGGLHRDNARDVLKRQFGQEAPGP